MMQHAEAETLAAFVDGTLDREELAAVSAHLEGCEECRGIVGEAVAFEREEMKPKYWRLFATAAVLSVAVLAAAPLPRAGTSAALLAWNYFLQLLNNRDVAQLLSMTVEDKRVTPGRFSGQEVYAVSQTLRGHGPSEDIGERFQLQLKVINLIERTENKTSPAALRSRAISEVYSSEVPRRAALTTLKSIPENQRNAVIWNDIAAVALDVNPAEALAAADMALKRKPKMPEALFNRAQSLQNLGRDAAAIQAWDDYLAVDSASDWAKEAQEKKQRLIEDQ
jgi:Putative zinc-finger